MTASATKARGIAASRAQASAASTAVSRQLSGVADDAALPDAPPSRPRLAAPLPRFVQIEPVGQCNLRCQMCAIQFRKDGPPHGPLAFLAFDDFKRLVEGFGDIDELQLQGLGEPTMHPRFFEMVAWASARGIRVSTNSNLTLWSERRARQCVESGLAALHVSLDAATPALYERIRRGARFAKVIRNLRRVMDARRALASPLHVRVVTVLMRQNLHELPALVRLASAEGVDDMFVQYLCHDFEETSLPDAYRPMRDFIHDEALESVPREALAHAFDEARNAAAACGVRLRLPPLERRARPVAIPRCDWPWRGAYVSFRGDAMPCCMVGTPDRVNFGNMLEDGVADVWNGAEYEHFREQLASDRPAAVCRSCALYRGVF
jgi:radical SAM protein with 4Fe4S-binding SPASM domain